VTEWTENPLVNWLEENYSALPCNFLSSIFFTNGRIPLLLNEIPPYFFQQMFVFMLIIQWFFWWFNFLWFVFCICTHLYFTADSCFQGKLL